MDSSQTTSGRESPRQPRGFAGRLEHTLVTPGKDPDRSHSVPSQRGSLDNVATTRSQRRVRPLSVVTGTRRMQQHVPQWVADDVTLRPGSHARRVSSDPPVAQSAPNPSAGKPLRKTQQMQQHVTLRWCRNPYLSVAGQTQC